MVKVYKWLHIFFFRLWFKSNNNIMPVGVPGNRDPNAICEYYYPFSKRPKNTHEMYCNCETDGHYLCKGCFFNVNNN